MDIPPGSRIELYSDAVYVSAPTALGLADYKVRLCTSEVLRETLHSLMTDLATRHSLTLFGQVCGRCGNSCRREGIVVREREIFRLRTSLGLTEEEFRTSYLDPARTWNPGDGVMRLRDGACPFLKPGPEGGIATCSIYDLRPDDCRMFTPNSPICRKDAGRLIQTLVWIKLEGPDRMEVAVRGGGTHVLQGEDAFWNTLKACLEEVEATPEERLVQLATRASKVARQMLEEFRPSRVDDDFRSQLAGLRHLVTGMTEISEQGQGDSELLEALWADVTHLEDLAAGRVQLPQPETAPLPRRRGSRVAWLHLTEEAVTALY
ncbi:MAG: YkgJ family cysteine cluster protein, partial [Candidatus Eremiobacterota bacterium]